MIRIILKTILVVCISCILIGTLVYVFRVPILRSMGRALMVEEDTTASDALVVLGGNSYSRSAHAAELFHAGRSPRIICTGGNRPLVLFALDTSMFEAEVSKAVLVRKQVPDSLVHILTESGSTAEEAAEICAHCAESSISSVTVVSDVLHMSRVKSVFQSQCPNLTVRYSGAPSQQYQEDEWWKSEEGMIMVNNEWMKRMYYFTKGF